MKDLTQVFPTFVKAGEAAIAEGGMLLRDWFATFAPEPTKEDIAREDEKDRLANPHDDNYKPVRRSRLQIIADVKYAYADVMMERR